MKRRFLLPLLVAAFALALGGACKKKEEGGEEADPAAKTAEEGAAEGEEAAEEPADEAEEEGGEEAAEGEGEAAATGIESCDAYVAAVAKYVECDKVPEQARDATKKGLEQMKAGWANMDTMPEEAKKAAADGCTQAMDALKKGAEAIGCEI